MPELLVYESNTSHLMGGFASARGLLVNLEHVESHSLGERPALANHDLIAWASIKAWGAVSRDHLVALLVTAVLSDVVQVVPTDGDGVLHEKSVDNATRSLPRMLTLPVKGHFLSM